jgi:DNA gyrase/topoisomerase IV subunit A
MKGRDFYLEVAYALSGRQLVEEEIKRYLSDAFRLARKCIGPRMPFKFSGEDYADSSLEGLIKAFKKLSENSSLIRDLEAFKRERNFLSHQGITSCLDYEQELAEQLVEECRPRLQRIQSEADRLRLALHEEANNFRGYLYFEDLDPGGD